jgi:hypothetical protein
MTSNHSRVDKYSVRPTIEYSPAGAINGWRWKALSDHNCETSKCSWQRNSGHQFAPLGQGGSAVLLEDVAAIEVTVLIEMIMDRGMGGGEFL